MQETGANLFLWGKTSYFGILGKPMHYPNGWPFPKCWGLSKSKKITPGALIYHFFLLFLTCNSHKLMYSERHLRAILAWSFSVFTVPCILETAVATLLPDTFVSIWLYFGAHACQRKIWVILVGWWPQSRLQRNLLHILKLIALFLSAWLRVMKNNKKNSFKTSHFVKQKLPHFQWIGFSRLFS